MTRAGESNLIFESLHQIEGHLREDRMFFIEIRLIEKFENRVANDAGQSDSTRPRIRWSKNRQS